MCRLVLPAGGFRNELLSFTAGRHDDQVDAIGLIGQLLYKMVQRAKVKPKERRRLLRRVC